VKATNGDTSLGGEDFDHRVYEYLIKQFEMLENDTVVGAISHQRLIFKN
jgi:molecular chaperone DnaK (HSP70)